MDSKETSSSGQTVRRWPRVTSSQMVSLPNTNL